jgi:hypothetical protein
MTNRNNDTINKNILDIFNNELAYPYRIQCDNEFNTTEFNKLMKEANVRVTYSNPNEINKNSIVERFNKTLEGLLAKYRLTFGKYDWYNYVYELVDLYNNTYHKTIKNTPFDVWNYKEYNEQDIVRLPNTLKIGDKVRIITLKTVFSKADEVIHSKDIYTVEKVLKNKVLLSNQKYYKPYEIIKVNDIIYLNYDKPNEEINEQAFKQQKNVIDINKKLKLQGLDSSNIINEKRIRK